MLKRNDSSVLSNLGIFNEALLKYISELVVILDKDYKIKYLNNKNIEKELGYTAKNLLDKFIISFIHPKDRKYITQILDDKNPPKTEEIKIRLLHNNGAYFTYTLHGELIINPETSKHYILIFKKEGQKSEITPSSQEFMEDISSSLMEIRFWKLLQSRKSKKVVEKSQELLQFILDNIPYYVSWKDKNSIYLGCNKNYAKIAGFQEPNEIIGKSDFELNWTKEDAKKIDDADKQALKSKKTKLSSETSLYINENLHWFDTNRIPLRDTDGKVIGVLKNFINITDRKAAHSALKKSEKKFRHLFESSPYAIWIMDLSGRIINYNSAMERLISGYITKDYKKGDFIGKNFLELVKTSKDAHDLVPMFEERFNNLVKYNDYNPIELTIRNSEGEKFWALIHSTIIELGDKKLIQTMIQDITEKKKIELNIKKSRKKLELLNRDLEKKVKERTKELEDSERRLILKNEKLKKTDQIKNEFIQYATHELKTPLISIGGYVDYILVKHHEDLNPEIKNDLNIVRKNVFRLEKLMNQLMDVMKIEEKKLSIQLTESNINKLVEDCIKELSFQTHKKEIEIINKIDNSLVLEIDPERLFQVFSNLLSNAIKFSPPKSEILIDVKKESDFYLFTVKDSGIGIENGEIENLFNKFEKVRNPLADKLNEEGTGLGLYISKGIINAHKGKIWISSKGRNKGTTVYFTLPI
ncbi:MAG: putative Histidine kinase [Promethearchaeota archaeon]|nr:MAG: putative Histidine kinase [Candidatus Lokiarchaeota archaeon]